MLEILARIRKRSRRRAQNRFPTRFLRLASGLIVGALLVPGASHLCAGEQLRLKSGSLELLAELRPRFRIVSLGPPGQPPMLLGEPGRGLQLAFMEPEQIPDSYEPGRQPATVLTRTERSAQLRLASDEKSQLRYALRIELDKNAPVLHLEYTLENEAGTERELACWILANHPPEGRVLIPFGADRKDRRRLVLPWWTAWPQPGVEFGIDALAYNPGSELNGNAFKIGIIAPAGWIAYVRGEQAMVSLVGFDPAAVYPEDGANISVFADRKHCETEHMGALQKIPPGGGARLSQSFRWIPLAKPVPDSPDELRQLIESQLTP